MHLYKAVVMHAFGRGSERPFRAALLRIAGLSIGAFGLGLVFSASLRNIPFSPITQPNIVFFGSLFITQIVILLTLYASAGLTGTARNAFDRLLLYLPVHTVKRGMLLLMPTLLLVLFALLLLVWPLATAMLGLGLPPLLLPVAVSLGVLSALGLLYSGQKYTAIHLVAVVATLWSEYKLLHLMGVTDATFSNVPTLVFCVLIMLLVGLFGYSAATMATHIARPIATKKIYTTWLPAQFWFIKKVIRNRSIMINLFVSFALSLGLAIVSKRKGISSAPLFALAAALLAGSFASDIRALARRYNPAEITILRGTLHFMIVQVVVACIFGALVALPLASDVSPYELPSFVVHVALGIGAGLLAGTIIVPEARDIMSQFLALLLVLTLLVGVPQLPIASSLSTTHHTALLLAAAMLSTLLAVGLEYKRNRYKWKDISA